MNWKSFLLGLAERALKTFGQGAVAGFVVIGTTPTLHVIVAAWQAALLTGVAAASLSVLTSLASLKVPGMAPADLVAAPPFAAVPDHPTDALVPSAPMPADEVDVSDVDGPVTR